MQKLKDKTKEDNMERRVKEIIARCEGAILDVGCVGPPDAIYSDFYPWLHGKLVEKFSNVLGIDIQKEAIEELKKQGYNVICCDMENFETDEKFDTIVAAEVIDYFSNIGNFFDYCRKHLKDNGKLIITVANPFKIELFIRKIFGKELNVSPGHVAWYDEIVLSQLARRHGFEVVDVEYIIKKYNPNTISGFVYHKIVFPILQRILQDDIMATYILFDFDKKK